MSNQPKSNQPKPITYALQDSEILELLAALPNTTMGRRYGFAFQLMATYGLKAADLRYLQVCSQESELWLRSRRHGAEHSGRSNEPCRLQALKVVNVEGIPQDWNLVRRVVLGERLPPLGNDSEADRHLELYLNDKAVWRQIQINAQRSGQKAMVDSFCERYASSAQNLDRAMGNADEEC
ncbi:hypothetical protein SynBIOSE41_00796 [Synechococcus sp. BIOS-E4-1]|uniref:hypothetical protein n=1 Tax=Synechococcus sp. BIOS-E4-1 TaxID=1400864 RepID=UPI00164814CA|nr:hypothetical protein [Synechococcus sp. BIOS-E4-1]QNI53328.1 hypothetical protein SynBIOSE41_00796 [Synechococcus sp. BIOS-E4-1]